jgi:hypothetical protein
LDPDTGDTEVTTQLSLSSPIVRGDDAYLPYDIAIGQGAVWISTERGQLDRIDPRTGEVAAEIALPPETTGGVAAGLGGVWVAEGVHGVDRIDPASNRPIDTIALERGTSRLSVDQVEIAGGFVAASGVWAESITDETGAPDYQSTGRSAVGSIDPGADRVVTTLRIANGFEFRGAGGRAWISSDARFAEAHFTAHDVTLDPPKPSAGSVIGIAGGTAVAVDSAGQVALLRD